MQFKMKFTLCLLAMAFAGYARAQENAGQTKATESPAASQAGKALPQDENRTGENQNRRRNKQSDDAQNRTNATESQTRTREERDRRETTSANVRPRSSSDKPLDGQLAACLLVGNQKEVAISQFASERAKNQKVKDFAKQMVKDHTQAITMLQRFAGPDASKDLGSLDSTRVNRSETTVERSTTSADANRSSSESEQRDANRNINRDNPAKAGEANPTATDAATRNAANQVNRDANATSERNRSETAVRVRSEHEAMPDKMLAIQREVAQKCIAMAKQELEQSSNFDQAYVGMQIAEHMGMIAHLETFKSYASEDLGKVIQESLDTAQGHLRHAKELVQEIGSDSASNNRSSPRTDANSRGETSERDRNPAKRDDATRRDGDASKKDAPKS